MATNPFNFGQAAKLMAKKFSPAASGQQPKPVTTPSQPANRPSPMSQAAKNVQVTPQATYKSPQVETLDKMNTFINNNSNYQFKQPDEFKYDQNSDPSYLAQLAEAKRNVQDQQVDTNAMLRASGQGKSSYSETVANQIGTKAMTSLADTLVPQLMQQAYQRYNDDSNRNLQVQQMNYGTQQDAVSNLAGLYGLQDKEYFQNPITEGELTGNYLPMEARQAIAGINSLKKKAETKGVTAEARSGFSMEADELRATLRRLGIDPSFYGADKTLKQSSQNNPGIRTIAGQTLDSNKQAQTFNQGMQTRQQDFSEGQQGWQNNFQNRQQNFNEGQQGWQNNFQNRQQDFNEGQQQWQNNFASEQQAYTAARAAISDSQWQSQFDQNVKQAGLDYALSKLQHSDSTAYQQAQLALGQSDDARQWAAQDYNMSQGGGTAKYNGMSTSQVLDSARKMFTVTDNRGVESIPTNPEKQEEIYKYVGNLDLPVGQDDQVMLSLGLTAATIKELDKKHGVPSGG